MTRYRHTTYIHDENFIPTSYRIVRQNINGETFTAYISVLLLLDYTKIGKIEKLDTSKITEIFGIRKDWDKAKLNNVRKYHLGKTRRIRPLKK